VAGIEFEYRDLPGHGCEQLCRGFGVVPAHGLQVSHARCCQALARYLNVGAAAGDGTPFHVEWLRAAQLTLIGFSATRAEPADIIASYQHVAALAAAGSLALPAATYSLDEATQAWEAQASSPGKKIVLIP
jgi:hypothetical protein